MRQLLYILSFLIVVPLAAQPGTITPETIQFEKSYIEAKREALLGKTEKAIELFKALIEAAPENDALQFELGRLLYASGNTDGAIEALKKAYGKRPNEVYAAFLAELYQSSGLYKEGAALFAELMKRNPGVETYYLEQAAFLVRAQDIKGAISVYNQLEDKIGKNQELVRRKHALYLGQGDMKRAEKELTELIKAQPDNLNHRHLLAGFYKSQGETNKARKTYEEILSMQPADVRAQLALQNVSTDRPATGDVDELLKLLARTDVDIDLKIGKILPLVQQVAQQNGSGARPQATVPNTFGDASLGQRAMTLAAELRRVHPDEAKAAAIQGDLFYHTGQLTKAAAAYRNTLELDDTVYPVWEQLLATLYLDNQITELRRYAEAALDIFPNRPVIYVQYALGEALRANFGEANSLLDQARIMVSSQPEATTQLETLSNAFAGLEAGAPSPDLDLSHIPGAANSPLGFLLQNSGDAAALRAYDSPGNTNALFLELLGDALKKSGDKANAAKAYSRAKAAGSKSSSLRQKMTEAGS